MKYQTTKKYVGISEQTITALMMVMSQRDDCAYSSFTILHFTRPAICLTGDGCQKTVAVETAKQIIKESGHGETN